MPTASIWARCCSTWVFTCGVVDVDEGGGPHPLVVQVLVLADLGVDVGERRVDVEHRRRGLERCRPWRVATIGICCALTTSTPPPSPAASPPANPEHLGTQVADERPVAGCSRSRRRPSSARSGARRRHRWRCGRRRRPGTPATVDSPRPGTGPETRRDAADGDRVGSDPGCVRGHRARPRADGPPVAPSVPPVVPPVVPPPVPPPVPPDVPPDVDPGRVDPVTPSAGLLPPSSAALVPLPLLRARTAARSSSDQRAPQAAVASSAASTQSATMNRR